jgi:hypothetical protein
MPAGEGAKHVRARRRGLANRHARKPRLAKCDATRATTQTICVSSFSIQPSDEPVKSLKPKRR